jgi:hypothetical protein
MSRQRRIPTPAWEKQGGVTDISAGRMKLYGLIGVVLLMVAAVGVIGYGFLKDYLDDQNRPGSTAVQVNDYRYSVEDFTKRAEMYIDQIGGSSQAQIILPTVGNTIIEEGILLESAGEKSVTATDTELKDEVAKLLGITADDVNFDARLQEELASTGLSREQYENIARATVLQNKLIEAFKGEVPATANSVHYRLISVADTAMADELKVQIDEGGDFEALAKENSLDTSTKDQGGDAGWVPEGFLPDALDNLLFSLAEGETVVYPTQSGATIYQVIEGDEAHEITDEQKTSLATDAFNEWIDGKRAAADITNDMDTSTGNADKIKYVVEHAGLTVQ